MFPTQCPVCKHNSLVLDGYYLVCDYCHVYRKPLNAYQRVCAWARGRIWWWRAIILLWLGFVYAQNIQDVQFALNRTNNVISAFDLGMHELGHILFIPLGQFMAILGGSLFQIIFPIMWAVTLYVKKWYFGAAACLCWLGFSLMDVAAYAADARARVLPLVSFSTEYDPTGHDWYQILSRLDKLQYDTAIAWVLRALGHVSIIVGILLCAAIIGYMLYWRIANSNNDNEDDTAY